MLFVFFVSVGMPFRCVSHVFALLHTRARNVKFTQGSAVPRSCDVLRLRPIPAVVRVRIKCESSKESAGWAGARRTPRWRLTPVVASLRTVWKKLKVRGTLFYVDQVCHSVQVCVAALERGVVKRQPYAPLRVRLPIRFDNANASRAMAHRRGLTGANSRQLRQHACVWWSIFSYVQCSEEDAHGACYVVD